MILTTSVFTETILSILQNIMFFQPGCQTFVKNITVYFARDGHKSNTPVSKRFPWISTVRFYYRVYYSLFPLVRYHSVIETMVDYRVHGIHACVIFQYFRRDTIYTASFIQFGSIDSVNDFIALYTTDMS